MEFMLELWTPILFSGLAVFVLSAISWTVLPFHNNEWNKVPNEDAVAAALRAGNLAPGLYSLPHAGDSKGMGSPDLQAKRGDGPVAFVTVAANGMPPMGPMMAKSVLYHLIVSIFVAYVASLTLAPGAEYLAVFRITGTVAFMAYALGTVPDSIWFAKPWKSYALHAVDSLVFGLVVGGFFGWLY